MAITTGVNKNKRLDALNAMVSTVAARLKIALIKVGATGTYDDTYVTYVSGMGGDEVAATGGYATGGFTLVNVTNALAGSVAQASHDDILVPNATIAGIGAVIYDTGDSNKIVSRQDWGGTKSAAGVDFTIKSPAGGFVSV